MCRYFLVPSLAMAMCSMNSAQDVEELLSCLQDIEREGRGALCVVACSGGRDSVALAHAAKRVFPRDQLHLAYVHHGLQTAADAQSELVLRNAADWGVSAVVLPVEVPREGALGRLGLEAAARAVRYRALARYAAELIERSAVGGVSPGAIAPVFILTAHHGGDLAENVILAALRGAGPRGLAGIAADRLIDDPPDFGMQKPVDCRVGRAVVDDRSTSASESREGFPSNSEKALAALGSSGQRHAYEWRGRGLRPIRLLRPWIDQPSQKIADYVARHHLRWVEDPSNQDLGLRRNAVRHVVMPMLEAILRGDQINRTPTVSVNIASTPCAVGASSKNVTPSNSTRSKNDDRSPTDGAERALMRVAKWQRAAARLEQDQLEAWVNVVRDDVGALDRAVFARLPPDVREPVLIRFLESFRAGMARAARADCIAFLCRPAGTGSSGRRGVRDWQLRSLVAGAPSTQTLRVERGDAWVLPSDLTQCGSEPNQWNGAAGPASGKESRPPAWLRQLPVWARAGLSFDGSTVRLIVPSTHPKLAQRWQAMAAARGWDSSLSREEVSPDYTVLALNSKVPVATSPRCR